MARGRSTIANTQPDNFRGSFRLSVFASMICLRSFILRQKIEMRPMPFSEIARDQSSRFIPAAAAKGKIGRSKIGSTSEIICSHRKIFADRSSSFPARRTQIELGGSNQSGRRRLFALQKTCPCRISRRSLSKQSLSVTTAESPTWPPLPGQIAFCFLARPIRRSGRQRTRTFACFRRRRVKCRSSNSKPFATR
jgi:hypothetical protein